MGCGSTFWHRFAGEPLPHLWFVLSEPSENVLAVCVSMTTSDPVGEKLLVIPEGTILTRPPESFRVPHDSTIKITRALVLSASQLDKLSVNASSAGGLTDPWLWKLRQAVQQGLDQGLYRPDVATYVRIHVALWFEPR